MGRRLLSPIAAKRAQGPVHMPNPRSIVILTGAGISAESGLPTFRDSNGLWHGHRPEEVATPQAFARDPDLVHGFYNARRRQLESASVQPNDAHHALAKLEQSWSGDFLLVTQNVDDLHERSGSGRLIHMHGELAKVRCEICRFSTNWREELDVTTKCPRCDKAGAMRPDIVWFGEMPLEMDRIDKALLACDLFVAIGTSGNVYPAAGFVDIVRRQGRAHTVEINMEPSSVTSAFAEQRYGKAGTLVPAFVDELLNSSTG